MNFRGCDQAPALPEPWELNSTVDLASYSSDDFGFGPSAAMWILQTDRGWAGPSAFIVQHDKSGLPTFTSSSEGARWHHEQFADESGSSIGVVAFQMGSSAFERLVKAAQDLDSLREADFGELSIVRAGAMSAPDFTVDVSYGARYSATNRNLWYFCDQEASTAGELWPTDPLHYHVVRTFPLGGAVEELAELHLGGLPALGFAQQDGFGQQTKPHYLAIAATEGRLLMATELVLEPGPLQDLGVFTSEFDDLDLGGSN